MPKSRANSANSFLSDGTKVALDGNGVSFYRVTFFFNGSESVALLATSSLIILRSLRFCTVRFRALSHALPRRVLVQNEKEVMPRYDLHVSTIQVPRFFF